MSVWEEIRYYIVSNYFSKLFVNYIGKTLTLLWRSSADTLAKWSSAINHIEMNVSLWMRGTQYHFWKFSSVQFSHSVMSDSLRPHGLQHTRSPCPSTTPRVYSNSCPLSWWCHPTISSSVIPSSSHLQSFPASGSFPMSQFFASGGQSIVVSAKYWSFSFRSLSSLLHTSSHQIVKDREAWHAVVHGVAKSWTCLSDFTTIPPQKSHPHPSYRPSDSQA